jgi:glycine betaine/proline transport system permease protein
MIGARGLGYEVLLGINRLEVGRGLLAGIGIVILAIIFDRISQSYGKRIQERKS